MTEEERRTLKVMNCKAYVNTVTRLQQSELVDQITIQQLEEINRTECVEGEYTEDIEMYKQLLMIEHLCLEYFKQKCYEE